MSTRVQWRRGNTAQTATFTGAVAEITVDTDKNVIVVHDGVTAGGHPAPTIEFTQSAFDKANAAAYTANNVAPQVQPAFDKANASYILAQGAYDSANNVAPQVQPAFDKANAAFNKANTAYDTGTNAYNYAAVIQLHANAAFDEANAAYSYVDTQIPIFQGIENTQNTNITNATTIANYGFTKANAAFDQANSAYSLGNAALPAAGGTISGSLYIQNDLTVDGTVTYTGNVNVVTITGQNGEFFGLSANGFNALYAGLPSGAIELLPNEVAEFTGANNSYVQINFQNQNGGTSATTDWIATANNGTDVSYYVDLGIAGDGYNNSSPDNSLGTSLFPNDSYLYAQGDYDTPTNPGGNLVIGATSTGKHVRFIAGGGNSSNVVLDLTPSAITLSQPLVFSDATTQTTASISSAASQVIYNTSNASFTQANAAFVHANSSYNLANTVNGYITLVTYTTSGLTQVAVDTISSTVYRSVNYEVTMTSGSSYHTTDIKLIHDGASVWITQYGDIYTGSSLGTFSSDISGGSLRLLFTPTNSSTTIKMLRKPIPV
jgi:hypothetical protein